MSEAPASWRLVPLGEIAEVQLGKMLSAKAKTGRGACPYLRNINVRWHHIDVSDVFEMDFDAREVAKYELRGGDVLVCEGGEPGRAAVWREQMPGALYQKALHRVRFRADVVDPTLFAYQVELNASQGTLARRFTGSTIKHLPREAFLEYEVIVPPLAEQRRIVAALEEHLSDLDAAMAGLERARANVRRFRSATVRATADGSLLPDSSVRDREQGPDPWSPAVPHSWKWSTVDELSELVEYGTSQKTSASIEGVPVLRMGNITDGQLRWDGLKYLPGSHVEFPRLILRPGDVLFNRTNSPELVGKSAVYSGAARRASFASYLLRVRLKPVLLPEFLSAYLNSQYGRAWISRVVSQQVGQANVNGSKLRALSVPVPPLSSQRRLVDEMERRLAIADHTAAEIDIQLARAARLRQSILKRAFEGKLVPQDPNDEPASALLDRIRESRESMPARRNGSAPKARTR